MKPATFLSVIAATAFLASSAAALSKDEAREIVLAADPDRIEAAFADLYATVRSGDIDQDTQRKAYEVFSVTDPAIHAATQAWRDAYPDSIHARTAQGWTDFSISWHLRGGKSARQTHPDALREFSRLMRSAQSAGLDVFDVDPSFLPASDLIFRTARPVRPPRRVEFYLDTVMERIPNYGSLMRASFTTAPHWGGSWRRLKAMCKRYAGQVADYDGFTEDVCVLDGGLWNRHDYERLAPYAERIGRFDGPILERWILNDALFLRPNAPGAASRARAAVEDPEFTDAYLAYQYDERIAARKRWPSVSGDVLLRRGDKAAEDLVHDPYNPQLVHYVREAALARGIHSPEAELDLARRAIQFDFYDPDAWRDLQRHELRDVRDYEDPLAQFPYWINRVYYSQYRPDTVSQHMTNLHRLVTMKEEIGAIRGATDEQRAEMDAFPIMTLPEEELLCPFVRAYRIYEAVCGDEHRLNHSCNQYGGKAPEVIETATSAKAARLCPLEVHNPLEELLYKPVPVEFWRDGEEAAH